MDKWTRLSRGSHSSLARESSTKRESIASGSENIDEWTNQRNVTQKKIINFQNLVRAISTGIKTYDICAFITPWEPPSNSHTAGWGWFVSKVGRFIFPDVRTTLRKINLCVVHFLDPLSKRCGANARARTVRRPSGRTNEKKIARKNISNVRKFSRKNSKP